MPSFPLTAAILSPRVAGLLVNTFYYAAGVCAVSLPIGALLALLIVKTDMPGRKLFAALLGPMLFVPLYLQAAAWMAGFAAGGWLGASPGSPPLLAGWRGAIWIHAMAAVPWVALWVGVALYAVEPELEEDALLDATPWRVFIHVTLRRAAGGLVAAALWVAVWCASETTVTDLFQIRTFAEEIHLTYYLGGVPPAEENAPPAKAADSSDQLAVTADAPSAPTQLSGGNVTTDGWEGQGGVNVGAGLAITTLLVVLAIVLCRRLAPRAVQTAAVSRWRWPLRRARLPCALIGGSVTLLLVGVPFGALFYKTGVTVNASDIGFVRGWSIFKVALLTLRSPGEYGREMYWSLVIGLTAATAAVLLGALLAWLAVARTRSAENRSTLAQPALWVAAICLALPAPMLGVGLIHLFNGLGADTPNWLAYLYDRTITAPAVVQTVRSLPLAILVLWHALSTLPRETLESAELEGAGWARRLALVALPARASAVFVAWVVCFAFSLGELAATVLVTPPGVTPLSVRIFTLLHYGMEDNVSSICLALWLGYLLLFGLAGVVLTRCLSRGQAFSAQ